MSNLDQTTNDEVIDFTEPQTPPPNNKAKQSDTAQLSGLASPSSSVYSPQPPKGQGGEDGSAITNNGSGTLVQQGSAAKWSSQTVYLRVMGRKAGTTNNELSLAKPFKATPLNYSLMGLFSKESNEERQIRHMLKSYKSTLIAELQHCSKASGRHKKRVQDQYAEFEVHEGKLVGWGLKFIIPFFRMQAWSRLSRSTLMRDLSLELEQVMSQRVAKTSLFLTTFEESINRKNKFSIAMTEEFCMRPDSLLDRDMGLITMTQQLQFLDDICSSTTKRFMQFESEYAWHGQAMRRKILLRILKRYKTIPQISELTNIEEDLNWADFCLWYANRNKIINQLVLEYSDFVEDQREKEGRLFYRWHKSLYRAKEAYEAAEATSTTGAASGAAAGAGTSAQDASGDVSGGAGSSLRRSSNPRVSISAINSFRLAEGGSAKRGGTQTQTQSMQQGDGGGEGAEVAKDRGVSADGSIEGDTTTPTVPAAPTSTTSPVVSSSSGGGGAGGVGNNNNNGNSSSSGAQAPTANVVPAPGAPTAGGPSDGIIALKVTPFSIKAFIKYFANDIIGVQYEIPKDCMAANLALTEALFFRRIHSHIYQYHSPHMYNNDQAWRQQCQLCRFVDPTTYHVPPKYASTKPGSAADAPKYDTKRTVSPGKESSSKASPPRSTAFPAAQAQGSLSSPPPGPGTAAPAIIGAGQQQRPMETIQEEGDRHADQLDDHLRLSDETPAQHQEGEKQQHQDKQKDRLETQTTPPPPPDTNLSLISPPSHADDAAAAENDESAPTIEDCSPPPPPPAHSPPQLLPSDADAAWAAGSAPPHKGTGASEVGSNAIVSASGGSKSPSRLKMRLVSDDSTIYKTCFNEKHTSSGGGDAPHAAAEARSSLSLLRASFGGFGSPKTSNKKTYGESGSGGGGGSSLSQLPEDLIADLPAENPLSPERDKVSSYSFGAAKTEERPASGYQDSPAPADADRDNDSEGEPTAESAEANTISSYKMGGQLTSDLASGAPSVSALDQIAAIKGSPQLAGHSPQYGTTLKSLHNGGAGGSTASASISSRKKHHHHNSNSPRSYLTANALKANDRALTAPGCACKMCATFAAAARLARLPRYTEGQYGVAYARSSRVMSFLTTASTPGEIISILALASKWLLRDAIDVSGSRDTIGADLLVPLFTMVLINAQLPNVHMILQVLLDYGEYNEQGDVSYTIANLEGSILFILGMEVPAQARTAYENCSFALANPAFIASNRHGRNSSMSRDIKSKYSNDALCELGHASTSTASYNDSSSGSALNNTSTSTPAFTEMSFAAKAKDEHTEEDVVAMKQLGEWLRDQNTMEDTITILQKEGWMA